MSKSMSLERDDMKNKTSEEKVPAAESEPNEVDSTLPNRDGGGDGDRDRWKRAQQRLREQAELFRAAETVRETVEVMLQTEVEEGTREEDQPMSWAHLDKRKQRINGWLGHLSRLHLAEESMALTKAKFELTKSKVDGDTVSVTPDVLLDHQALVNLLKKRWDVREEFKRERDALKP